MGLVSPSQVNPGDEITSASVNTPINQLAAVVNGSLDSDNISSLTGAKIQSSTLTGAAPDSTYAGGWLSGRLPSVSSVTNNGNGSKTLSFASTVASTLSPGMRLQITKTVAGNGYMGGLFNGSSHYFTKTTPSGTLGTVTNNFTLEAVVMPTSYADGAILCRSDAGVNNSITLAMMASGVVRIIVTNTNVANYRYLETYQSLPLNRKTHVAVSWTSGTVVIYFNGISVPLSAAVAAGTSPTTAGTGGDFAIGRRGASATYYFPGYISNVAAFDAVLSAATIRQHATYKLLGSETNCIGAWSLDNTANDQSSAANNLTATGGVGFTASSPHGMLHYIETTKAVALVMSVSTTDVVCQVPEGCTIPTTGGITSVAYSTVANPYGWITDRGRWTILSLHKAQQTQAAAAASTWYNLGSQQLSVPIGAWILGYQTSMVENASTAVISGQTLSTANNSESDSLFSFQAYSSASGGTGGMPRSKYRPVNLSSQTTYYLNTGHLSGTGVTLYNCDTSFTGSPSLVEAIPAGI